MNKLFRLTSNRSVTLRLVGASANTVRIERIERIQGVERNVFTDLIGKTLPFSQLKEEVLRRLGDSSEEKAPPVTYRGVVIFPDNSRVEANEARATLEAAFRDALAYAPAPLTRGCVVGVLVG